MTSELNHKDCIPSIMEFFVRNQKFIQFVTRLKKNFQDRTKIDEDIDKFDEDVLTMNRLSSAFDL